MQIKRETVQMALDVLTEWKNYPQKEAKAIAALREALARPEPEPVAWYDEATGDVDTEKWSDRDLPLYLAPPA